MTFSAEMRAELCAQPIKARHCAHAEYQAFMDSGGRLENRLAAQRFVTLTKLGFGSDASLQRTCCQRAYMRGAFIAGGILSNPSRTYHLEFTFESMDAAERFSQLLNNLGLPSKVFSRKGLVVVYVKDADNIVDALNHMRAHKSLLILENLRVEKDMRNVVNRKVNCEAANINKTVNAAQRQLAAIRHIASTKGLSSLSAPLEEVARLRLQYEDASLEEIGAMANPPVGKSGINHRMRKICEIARQLG